MDAILRTDCQVAYTTPSLSTNVLHVNCAAKDNDIWHWKYFWSKTIGTPDVVQTQETSRSIIPTVVIAGEDTATTGNNHQIVMRTMFAYVADNPIPITVNASMQVNMSGSSAVSDLTNFQIYTKVFKPDGELVSTIYDTTVGVLNGTTPSIVTENRSYSGVLPATACPLVCFSWMRSVGTVKTGVDSKIVYGTYDIEFDQPVAESRMSLVSGTTEIANLDTFSFSEPSVISDANDNSGSVSHYFTVYNKSVNPLVLYGDPVFSGPNASDFYVAREYDQTIMPTGNGNTGASSLILGFKPRSGASGSRTAQLTILSNDPTKLPFTLNLQGQAVTSPYMAVYKDDGSQIWHNSSTYGPNPEYFLKVLNGFSESFTLTIKNTGSSNLLLNGSPLVQIDPPAGTTGYHPEDFSVTSQPTNSNLAPGESTSFTVKFEPSSTGKRRARIKIPCNDTKRVVTSPSGGGSPAFIINLECLSYTVGQQLTVLESSGAALAQGASISFGNVSAGQSVIKTFTVRNSGEGFLDISYMGIGVVSLDYSLYSPSVFNIIPGNVYDPIPAGGSSTFSVKYTPTKAGFLQARIYFYTSDLNRDVFYFDVSGTGTENTAEAAVVSSTGTVLTTTIHNESFGSVVVGKETSRTFTIRNLGAMALTLGPISVGGTNSSNYVVTSQPSSSVVGYGSTTFTVKFTPTVGSSNSVQAKLSLPTGDPAKPILLFNLNGFGTAPTAAEISVEQPAGVNIATNGTKSFGSVAIGEKSSLIFTVTNSGDLPLNLNGTPLTSISGTNAADFSVIKSPPSSIDGKSSTTFEVQFSPTGTSGGNRSATLAIPNNDGNENPFVINLTGTAVGPTPEIVVEQAGANVAHNDGKSFGYVTSGTTSSLTFVIRNIGTATLNLGTASITGTNATNFTITSPYASTVAVNGTTTFTVMFTPTGAAGGRVAAISIPNNDTNEAPFVINLTATVGIPDITVEHNGATIARNGTVDFGTQELGAPLIERTFTIRNTGNGDLILTGAAPEGYPDNTKLTFSGTGAVHFSTADVANPATVIPAGGTTTFIARFGANQVGTYAAKVTIASNDPDETPYEINLTGITAQTVEIAVIDPYGNELSNNGTVNFGPVLINSTTSALSLTFTVKSVLTGQLNLQTQASTPRVSTFGTNAGEYVVTAQPSQYVAGGTSTTFTVKFSPTALGTRTAGLRIYNNDADETPFVINVSGSGVNASNLPQIRLSTQVGSIVNQNINAGDTVDFGNTGLDVYKVFTIKNDVLSTLPSLLLTGNPLVSIGGTNAADFVVTLPPSRTIYAGSTTTFTVRFSSTATSGTRSATLSIASNDLDSTPFQINLTATGAPKPAKFALVPPTGVSLASVQGLDVPRVHFGQLAHNLDKSVTLTITNNGATTLNLPDLVQILPSYGDAASNAFSITSQCATSVAPGGSTTFTVRFKYPFDSQSVPIDYKVKLRINHNSPLDTGNGYTWNNPADFEVVVSVLPAPSVIVTPEGATGNPVIHNGTFSFGPITQGSNTTKRLEIANEGYLPLNLTGSPALASLSGTNAGDFSITTFPTTPIAGPYTRNPGPWLAVQFTPSGAGARVAKLTIPSNDWRRSAHIINLEGNGISSQPELDVEQPEGTNIEANGVRDFGNVSLGFNNSLTFVIRNTGSSSLNLTGSPRVTVGGTNSGDFVVTQQPLLSTLGLNIKSMFTVRFTPSALGSRSAYVSIASNDANENPFVINLAGTCVLPPTEIEVQQGGIFINNNGVFNFDPTTVGDNLNRTFTIANKGAGTLNLTGTTRVSVTGVNPSEFTVTSQPSASVAASASTNFIVRFAPSAAGTRSAILTIPNNDDDENPFVINVSGNAVAPEMTVSQSNVAIISGGSIDFGRITSGSSKDLTFSVSNSGAGILRLTGATIVSVGGANSADFNVIAQPSNTIATSTQSSFQVRFSSSTAGARSATLSIPNNDSDENPYVINITGTVVLPPPEIAIEDQGTNIITGGSKDFGNIALGSSISIPLEIKNTAAAGSANLNLTGSPRAAISGTHAEDFTVTTQPSASVIPTGSTTVIVKFTPSALLTRRAVLTISHDDNTGAENPFLINLSGNGALAPEIDVETLFPTVGILTGGSTNFGSVVTGNTVTKTFKIRNSSPAGASILQLTGTPPVEVKGSHAADFTVTTQPSTNVYANNSVNFVVSFTPSALGARSAQLSIPNNDSNEHPYLININGVGQLTPPEISIEADGVAIASATTKNFGQVGYGRDKSITFTIRNLSPISGQNLDLTNTPIVTIVDSMGHPSNLFSVTTQPNSTSIAPGGSTAFVVKYNTMAGLDPLNSTIIHSARLLVIHNDDSGGENPYVINLIATSYTENGVLVVKRGSDTISSNYEHSFGNVNQGSASFADFEIVNDNDNPKNISLHMTQNVSGTVVNPTGANPSDFVIETTGDYERVGKFLRRLAPIWESIYVSNSRPEKLRVYFKPTTQVGTRTAQIEFRHNGTGAASPFVLKLKGIAGGIAQKSPELAVEQGGTNIAASSTINFGTVVGGSSASLNFAINNIAPTGADRLNLTSSGQGVLISGVYASYFSITYHVVNSKSIAAQEKWPFTIKYTPPLVSTLSHSATVTIPSNASNIPGGSFVFTVTGTSQLPPKLTFESADFNSSLLTENKPDSSTYVCGPVWYGQTKNITITIKNTGAGTLNLTGSPIVKRTIGTTCSVTSQPTVTSVSSGGSTTFTVTCAPIHYPDPFGYPTLDTNVATEFEIASNLPQAPNFKLKLLVATGLQPPKLLVTDAAGNTITNNDYTIDFGTQPIATSHTRKFFIKNIGPSNGKILTHTRIKTSSSAFTVDDKWPYVDIKPGESSEKSVTLFTRNAGPHTERLEFGSNDIDQYSFYINLKAYCTGPQRIAVEGGTGFTARLGSTVRSAVFIRNLGTEPLVLTGNPGKVACNQISSRPSNALYRPTCC